MTTQPPEGRDPARGPQSPEGPQSPADPPRDLGPQGSRPPAEESRLPDDPQAPEGGPQSPGNAPGYSGPVPPGGWHQPVGGGAARSGEGNTPAIVALALGILGIVITLFTIGILGIVGLLIGIPAIVLGVMGRRKVARGETTQNRSIATAGLVTGIVSTILGLLAVIAYALLGAALLGGSGELQGESERQQRQLEQQR